MTDFAFKENYNETKLFLIGSIAVLSVVYLALELFFNSVTFEVAASWYASEKVSIQQGNLLSSVGKLQRIIHESKIIKGVAVLDDGNIELVGFGKTFIKPNLSDISKNVQKLIWVGPFRRVHVIATEKHKILLFSESSALVYISICIILYLLTIAGWLSIRFKKELTQRLRLENDLKIHSMQAENVIAEERAKIATQIAHDIRSPISSLNILFDMLDANSEKKSLINASFKRINDIANDLLALNKNIKVRNESDHTHLMEKFCLNKIFESLIDEKRTQISKNSKIRIEFIAEKDYFSCIPVVEFTRAMSNLLSNSLESIVDVGLVTISIESDKDKIKVVLMDTGSGIDPALIGDVMKGYSTKKGGSGLGLSSSINLLKKIGGGLELESRHFVGTTIKIELPRAI